MRRTTIAFALFVVAACGGSTPRSNNAAATVVIAPAPSQSGAPIAIATTPWPLGPAPPPPSWCAPPPPKDAPELLPQLGATGLVSGVELVPDGQSAVFIEGGSGNTNDIRVWDLRTGAMRAVYRGHRHGVRSVSFHPTTPVLVSTASEEPARLWDARNGTSRAIVDSTTGPFPLSALFSPDGQTIALGYKSGVKLLNANGDVRAVLDAPDWNEVRFSADGRSLLTYGPELAAKEQFAVWDVATGAPRIRVPKGPRSTHNAGISPDGRFVVWAPFEGPATITDIATGQNRATLQGPTKIEVVEVSRDGRTAMVGADGIALFDTTTGQKIADYTDLKGYHARLLPDGLIAANKSRHGLAIVRAGARTEMRVDPSEEVMAFAVTPDGATVIGALDLSFPSAAVWDARTGARRSTVKNQRTRARHIAWSPDSTQIAMLLGEGNGPADDAMIADLRTGAMRRLGAHASADMLETIAWSPTGDVIAAGTVFEASLYDARTGKRVHQLDPDEQFHATHEVAFLPGGRVVTTAAKSFKENEVRVHDPKTGARLATWASPVGHVQAIAVSPEGARIALAGGGAIAVIDAQSGATLTKASGAGNTLDAAWTPDGAVVATIADRGPLALWDARSGTQLAILEDGAAKQELGGHLAVSLDGRVLVSGNSSGVSLWDLRTRTLLTKIAGESESVGSVRWAPGGDIVAIARAGVQLVRMRDGQSVFVRSVEPQGGGAPSALMYTTSGSFAGEQWAMSLLRVRQGPDFLASPIVGVEQARTYRPNLIGDLFGGCGL
jgi:WD40 repeat protein